MEAEATDSRSSAKTCPACFSEVNARAIKCPRCGSRQPDAPPMHRGPGRIVAGVCAMIASQVGVDPKLVRLAWVVAMLFSGGLALGVYMLSWVVTAPSAAGQAPLSRWLDAMERLFKLDPPPQSRHGDGPRF